MKKEFEKLIHSDDIEEKVVSILIANDLVRKISVGKGAFFSNIRLTKKGRKTIGSDAPTIPDDWMDKFRDLFPDHRRSSPKSIRTKMEKFFMEYGDYDLDDIYTATKMYMRDLENPRFCVQANNFFYKYDPDRTMSSVCLQYLDLLEEKGKKSDEDNYSGSRMI